jgi:putative serine protease PepD
LRGATSAGSGATSTKGGSSVTSGPVTPKGPHPFGGGPEPDGARDDDRATGGPLDDNEDAASHGWIPPEHRDWRHPSEVPTAAGGTGGTGPGTPMSAAPARGGPGRRRWHLATIGVGVGAAAAVLAGVLLLANAGSGNGPAEPSTADSASVASAVSGCCKLVPTAAEPTERSMVALEVSTSDGVAEDCGVAVAPGGLVVTTADAVDGARTVTAVVAGGTRVGAAVLAVDRGSDVAVVRVDADVPVARFADDATVSAGHAAMVIALAARSGNDTPDAPIWADGSVQSVATAIQGGDASGLAALTTGATAVPAMPGSALLEPTGQVIGILDSTGRPAAGDGEEVFLPSQLVVGVADALAQRGYVQHGWLDVTGRDASATTSDGAEVVAVKATGPSAHALEPGDVIVSLDGAPVRSMAELRSRLYVLGPGTIVHLGVERDETALDVDVTLASSP